MTTLLYGKDEIDMEDVISSLLANELRKKGKITMIKRRTWWHEEEKKTPVVRTNIYPGQEQTRGKLNLFIVIRKGTSKSQAQMEREMERDR